MPPEQEVVELNLKVLVPDERNKKQENTRSKILTVDFLPMQECPSLLTKKKSMKSLPRRPKRVAQTRAAAEGADGVKLVKK